MNKLNYFLGEVLFEEGAVLEELAGKLPSVIGIDFVREDSGKYEEVPAYVGASGSVEAVLFGTPEDEEGDSCLLQISFDSPLPLIAAAREVPQQLQNLILESKLDSTGHMNFSGRLVELLRSFGFLDCAAESAADEVRQAF